MSATLVRPGCAPVAVSADGGTVVWYERSASVQQVWDVWVGDLSMRGRPLLPAYPGNRGPADITPDGRYVLLTTAYGSSKEQRPASDPGVGRENAIELFDRQGEHLVELVKPPGWGNARIWPRFNADASKIVWGEQTTALGWSIKLADLDLTAMRVANVREWKDPERSGIIECYGWLPSRYGDWIVFMAPLKKGSLTGFHAYQLWVIPGDLKGEPKRVSPQIGGRDEYQEFVRFAPWDDTGMFVSSTAQSRCTGIDLWRYDLKGWTPAKGRMPAPARVTWFNGPAHAGFPAPSYKNLTTMVFDPASGAQIVALSPDLLGGNTVEAWRIDP